jgi:hypothetical protein
VEPRFILDANVGRLAKWLRALGYDAAFVPDVDDGELLRLAIEQDQCVVTRDRRILERRVVAKGPVKAVLATSDDAMSQVRQLAEELDLNLDMGFSRCIECNASLSPVDKRSVEGRVPPFVFRTQDRFHECPTCARLYWRGTHWRNMRRRLAKFRKES